MTEDKFAGLENALLNLEAAFAQLRVPNCSKEDCRDSTFCEGTGLCKQGVTNFNLMTNRFMYQADQFAKLDDEKRVPEDYIAWFKNVAGRGWNLMNRSDNGSSYLRSTMELVTLRIGLVDSYSVNPIEDF